LHQLKKRTSLIERKADVVGAYKKKEKIGLMYVLYSYETREFGVHSTMPISQVYKLYPDATFYLRI
jgi:nucleotidyltransferase/DNA polymerase involved in DNA repair